MSRRSLVSLLTVVFTAFAACSDEELDADKRLRTNTDPDAGADGGGGPIDPNAIPFEPVTAAVYVPKVKNLLTGLAPTDAEVQAVIADPNALKGLIDGWMTLPSFKVRMLDFFRNAFQQNQVVIDNLELNLNQNFQINDQIAGPLLARNIMDSFPFTVWKLMEEGKPFNDALTTRRYMMTTAMLSVMAYFDDIHVDDARKTQNRLATRNALTSYTFDSTSTVTNDDALNPASANFMKFKFPGTQPDGCATTTQTFTQTGDNQFYNRLFGFFLGRSTFNPCNAANPPQLRYQPVFTDADWDDWRMVTFKTAPATAPGATPAFYELAKLRTASEVSLRADRLGFFGTLAFDANWGTNVTNEARVTANQSLIVSIGQSVAGENAVVTFPVDATDAAHASNPACTGCHAQIDPLKQFFRQSYTLYYGDQTDAKQINTTAGLNVGGVTQGGKGVGDLANILATHPRFPIAWVGKLHFWANSTPALESDPEVIRIAEAFAASKLDFKTLVRELFSSPLVTWASATETTSKNGVIVSIARRDQFCAALSNRMGLNDVCGMSSIKPTNTQRTVSQRASLLPVDTYYRAYALPSLPTNPDLFFRQSTEAICRLVADQVIDPAGGAGKYSSANPDAAIDDFVGTVMALVPSDPRAAKAKAILSDNFKQSTDGGAKPVDALKATFALACLSPSSVIVGL